MLLHVVRHAHAGPRHNGDPGDGSRSLSDKGWRQARAIAEALAPSRPERIVSSPKRRCRQTLEPLAATLGTTVEIEGRLDEGTPVDDVIAALEELAGWDAVVCTHGDVIPEVLHVLAERGAVLDGELEWRKASIWVVERDDGGWPERARYIPPPTP